MTTIDSLFEAMTPGQARALRDGMSVHMQTLIKEAPNSDRRLWLRTTWEEDKKGHPYRTIARIAGLEEEVPVNPLEVIEQIVEEDGPEIVAEHNDTHNRSVLWGIISLGLAAQQLYGLPDDLPAGRPL